MDFIVGCFSLLFCLVIVGIPTIFAMARGVGSTVIGKTILWEVVTAIIFIIGKNMPETTAIDCVCVLPMVVCWLTAWVYAFYSPKEHQRIM